MGSTGRFRRGKGSRPVLPERVKPRGLVLDLPRPGSVDIVQPPRVLEGGPGGFRPHGCYVVGIRDEGEDQTIESLELLSRIADQLPISQSFPLHPTHHFSHLIQGV